jgi:hypothetical protein
MNAARILVVGTLLALSFSTEAPAATNLTRQEIKQMPITQRPSRPGHFYGNTVRRAQARRSSR